MKKNKQRCPRIRFRFLNRTTGAAAETFVRCDPDPDDYVRVANTDALLACEHAVSDRYALKDELSILSYNNYMVWAVPGNAVKTYDKLIAIAEDVQVFAKLMA